MRAMILGLACLMAILAGSATAGPYVIPNDVNCDGVFDKDDPKWLFVYLFSGGPPPACDADANGDGVVDIADVVTMLNLLADAACAAATLGDVNGNGNVSLVDVDYLLNYLFLSGPAPVPCLRVADVNGDGNVNLADAATLAGDLPCPSAIPGDANSDDSVGIADALIVLSYLFLGGDPPPVPPGGRRQRVRSGQSRGRLRLSGQFRAIDTGRAVETGPPRSRGRLMPEAPFARGRISLSAAGSRSWRALTLE